MSDPRAASIAERRRAVLAQLADVEQQLTELRRMREREHDDDEHDPDGVSLSSEWSRLEGLRQTQMDALASVDEAAARLARGQGATCSVCGGPIAPERLEARPDATTCIGCAR
ncbi:TraR/DksA family transcriptional regulator [Agrococcus beijingensis]|uniref:TraR/DksA family transcriptional regulator n=1 Tax=Agrococcus beijingensis TaxID=3068634 RepID=UPI0027404725|nr:TraR/DksA C4-type zinc finger protein [Agrococcus sp. REN33]